MTVKKYRVEFNTTGFYSGQGIFETLDEIAEIEAENAQKAIEYSIDYIVESECAGYEDLYGESNDWAYDDNGNVNVEAVRERIEAWAWIAREIIPNEDGTPEYGETEYKE